MNFPPFIYDYVTDRDWVERAQDNNLNDYFGFDVTFTREDLENYNYDKINDCIDKYIDSHNFEVLESETLDFDLERSVAQDKIVFSYDNKYYQTYYVYSPFFRDIEQNTEIFEVFPISEIITKYMLKHND